MTSPTKWECQPTDKTAFIATGAISNTQAVSKYHAGIWFLGWRCLYAEIVHSRVENQPLDLERALKRSVAMNISRLKAYGLKWILWINASRHRAKPNVIGRKNLDKRVIRHEPEGAYEIHDAFWDLAKKLKITD